MRERGVDSLLRLGRISEIDAAKFDPVGLGGSSRGGMIDAGHTRAS
jgi:hypothetical protein